MLGCSAVRSHYPPPELRGSCRLNNWGPLRRILLITLARVQPTSIPLNSKFIHLGDDRRHFSFNSGPFNVNLNFCAYRGTSRHNISRISLRFNCSGILYASRFALRREMLFGYYSIKFSCSCAQLREELPQCLLSGETNFCAPFHRTNLSFVHQHAIS